MELAYLGLDEKEIRALEKKHIHTSYDLMRWFPRQYRDYRQVKDILDCRPGTFCAVKGRVIRVTVKGEGAKRYLSVRIASTGRPGNAGQTVWFGFALYIGKYAAYVGRQYEKYLQEEVVVTGKVAYDEQYGYSISYPEIFFASEFQNGIRCIYPAVKGLSQERISSLMRHYAPMHGDVLEQEVRSSFGIPSFPEALRLMHSPENGADILRGEKSFVFYDLLYFCLCLKKLDLKMAPESGIRFSSDVLARKLIESLPFPLTKAEKADPEYGFMEGGQEDALVRMRTRILLGKRLNALIEADVGSGKTILAAIFMVMAAENGYQSVLIAPKTVLARQHYEEINGYAEMLGIDCVYLHSGNSSANKKLRRQELAHIEDGTAKIIIGTKSCFSTDVNYHSLGLIVYDEEHQFGVDQKIALYEKGLPGVHTIEMSATPIPRSIAMSVYSNKDIERITVRPAGRTPVQTAACRKESTAFEFMEKQLAQGHQCYVVAPAIEDNEDIGVCGVKTIWKRCREHFEKMGYGVSLVHGKLKDEEFTKEIDRFKKNESQILVATTVVEVGVNIPNATVICIENAERFGLSQLHQLRGRVGRCDLPSYCILVTEDADNPRVKALQEVSDGFEVAERDLQLRGPGEINGTMQSGSNVYVSEAITYPDIFEAAKKAADMCTEKDCGSILYHVWESEREAE